jgi:hypothetical protein
MAWFFDQVLRSDVFVLYDDVQFDKHGWRNRNRIKSPKGYHWLTVPVLHKNQNSPLIFEIEIDNRSNWAKKHIGTIQQFYAKAPFKKQYLPKFKQILNQTWSRLVDLDIEVTQLIMQILGLNKTVIRSSNLDIQGGQSERLLNICKHFNATHYLSGDAAQDYLDLPLFQENQIQVIWQNYQHPVYSQQYDEFLPYLSIVDLLLNCGPDSLQILNTHSEEDS